MIEGTYGYRLPSQDYEALSTLHHEARKLVAQNPLDFISLLDLDAKSDRVERGFDEDAFVFIAGDDERVQEDFLGCATWTLAGNQHACAMHVPALDLWLVMTFYYLYCVNVHPDRAGNRLNLRGKVLERQGSRQGRSHCCEIRAQNVGLYWISMCVRFI